MKNYYQFTLYVECPDGKRCASRVNLDAARIDHDRKRLAETIAVQLTESILDAIKGRDLRNGYDQPQENSCEQTP